MLKKTVLLAAACGLCATLNAQTAQSENPMTFEGAYIGDTYANIAGGLARGTGYMGMGNIRIGLDTRKAGLWRGGEFYVNGASIHGKSLTENYLGDLQVASNIDAGEHAYLHELWFRQRAGRFTFTAGLQDLNADFMVSEGAGELLNSSFGVPPVIATGIPVPIFPLTGLGVAAAWQVDERWTLLGALFDGNQTAFDHNPHNVHWGFSRRDGVLAIGEVHFRGRYKLGAYYHSADANYGFYALADQPLSERVALFGQLAFAPKNGGENNFYLGAGLNLSGIFRSDEGDSAGLAVAHAGLHGREFKHETAVELFYKYAVGDNIVLQPDVQYVINPAGGEKVSPNALTGILRLHVNF